MIQSAMQHHILRPTGSERPVVYAERLGLWYSSTSSDKHKKELGQFFTPVVVADFMASLFSLKKDRVKILDPGAGLGVLTCAVCEHLAVQVEKPSEIYVDLYENDPELTPLLTNVLDYLKCHLKNHGISFVSNIITTDFVLDNGWALNGRSNLFPLSEIETQYDGCISNPPYFKLSKSDPRAQAASAVVHGQPNIYALFMAVAAQMLLPGGEAVFITPRSFTSGPYFRLFREHFFSFMRPQAIHLFDSRKDAFEKDGVLQENIILKACCQEGWTTHRQKKMISISQSRNVSDLNVVKCRKVRLDSVLNPADDNKILRIPTHRSEDRDLRIMNSWTGSLNAYGWEISTGPVVPFRAEGHLFQEASDGQAYAPLFWMQNVHRLQAIWPVTTRRKPQYVAISDATMPILLPVKNYVLLRRFSAKEELRRLTAAPFFLGTVQGHYVGLENHLNYIHKPGSCLSEEEVWGLSVLYNSPLFDRYFRAISGNTQVSATELRAIPLPPWETIVEMGKRAMITMNPATDLEAIVHECCYPGEVKTCV